MRREIAVTKFHRLLNAGPVVLVTTAVKGKQNVAPVAWVTPLSMRPPLVGICLWPGTFTHELVKRGGEFALNVPSLDLVKPVDYCGSVSGRDVSDKFATAGFTLTEGKAVEAPLIEECIAHLECGLITAQDFGDHTLFVGEVLAAWADSEAFDDEAWKLETVETKPLHYLGGHFYGAIESRVEVEAPETEEEE